MRKITFLVAAAAIWSCGGGVCAQDFHWDLTDSVIEACSFSEACCPTVTDTAGSGAQTSEAIAQTKAITGQNGSDVEAEAQGSVALNAEGQSRASVSAIHSLSHDVSGEEPDCNLTSGTHQVVGGPPETTDPPTWEIASSEHSAGEPAPVEGSISLVWSHTGDGCTASAVTIDVCWNNGGGWQSVATLCKDGDGTVSIWSAKIDPNGCPQVLCLDPLNDDVFFEFCIDDAEVGHPVEVRFLSTACHIDDGSGDSTGSGTVDWDVLMDLPSE